MEFLRRAHRLTCLLVAWFALSVGMAVAAPLVAPQGMDIVCSGSGVMTGGAAEDGAPVSLAGHLQDCRSCVMTAAPPPLPLIFVTSEAPAAAPAAAVPVFVAARTAAPLSARGPPLI